MDNYQLLRRDFQAETGVDDPLDLFTLESTNELYHEVAMPGLAEQATLVKAHSLDDMIMYGRYAPLWLTSGTAGDCMIDVDVLPEIVAGDLWGESPSGMGISVYHDGPLVHIQWPGEYAVLNQIDLIYLLEKLQPVYEYNPNPRLVDRPELLTPIVSTQLLGKHLHQFERQPTRRKWGSRDSRFFPGQRVMSGILLSAGPMYTLNYEPYGFELHGRFGGIQLNYWDNRRLNKLVFVSPDSLLRARSKDVRLGLRWPERIWTCIKHTPSGVLIYQERETADDEFIPASSRLELPWFQFEWLLNHLEVLPEGDPNEHYTTIMEDEEC